VTRRARTRCLACGLGLAAAAVCPPVDAMADRTLAAHMGQHMLLTMAAAPLVVIGSPLALALRLARPGAARRMAQLRTSRAVHRAASPLLAWSLLAGVQWLVYFTPLFELAERNQAVHAAEHVALFGAALMFWRPLVGVDPLHRLHPLAQVGYLLAAMPASDVIGIWLIFSTHAQYPSYAGTGLADQQRAGVIMLAGSLPLGLTAFSTAWRWAQRDHRRTLVAERAA
jgi:putative membrane protein